jgi:hypothetical protein
LVTPGSHKPVIECAAKHESFVFPTDKRQRTSKLFKTEHSKHNSNAQLCKAPKRQSPVTQMIPTMRVKLMSYYPPFILVITVIQEMILTSAVRSTFRVWTMLYNNAESWMLPSWLQTRHQPSQQMKQKNNKRILKIYMKVFNN